MRKIADSTIRRLSLYLRFLEDFAAQGRATVSSGELAGGAATTSAQVRKDLSFFGSFGKRGTGYPVDEMVRRLRRILGLGRRYRVALIGAGRIGSALVGHRGFAERGFDIVRIFDTDPAKIGQTLGGREIEDESRLEAVLTAEPVDMAVIVTPAEAAQHAADRLVALGVRSILNVAPVQLVVPATVEVRSVNLALELEALSFALAGAGADARAHASPG